VLALLDEYDRAYPHAAIRAGVARAARPSRKRAAVVGVRAGTCHVQRTSARLRQGNGAPALEL